MARLSRVNKNKKKTKKRQRGGCGCASKGMMGGKRRTKRRTKRRRRRKVKRVKKTKRRRRRKLKRAKKRQRGGNLLAKPGSSGFDCSNPKNLGAHFGNKLNTNVMPAPINSNNNFKQNGGGLWGDLQNYWWKGNDALTNTVHRYKGDKPVVSSDIMHQPGLSKDKVYQSRNMDLAGAHLEAVRVVVNNNM